MFSYVVLAFEFLFLTAAFWYVFIREEKPYEIVGNPWGLYPEANKRLRGQVCGRISPKGKVLINTAMFHRRAGEVATLSVSDIDPYVPHHGFVSAGDLEFDQERNETGANNVTRITEGKRFKNRRRVA